MKEVIKEYINQLQRSALENRKESDKAYDAGDLGLSGYYRGQWIANEGTAIALETIMMRNTLIFGIGEAQERVGKLTKKLVEAKEVANELASTKVYIQDTRKKELDQYIEELRIDFIKTFHHEPEGFYLVAEGQNGRCQISLSRRRSFSEK